MTKQEFIKEIERLTQRAVDEYYRASKVGDAAATEKANGEWQALSTIKTLAEKLDEPMESTLTRHKKWI